jgi:hypothetical protein
MARAQSSAVLVALLVARHARAEPLPADGVWAYEARAVAAMNPGSAHADLDAVYRHRLYVSDRPVLADNALIVTAGFGFSPASFRPSASVAILPLSVLRLWVRYDGEGYFGDLGLARSFPSPASDYGRGLVSPPPPGPAGATGPYSLWLHRFELGLRVQAQVSRYVFRSSWRALRFDAHLAQGDRVVYDTSLDDVVAPHGWAIEGDTDAGIELRPGGIQVGLRFSLVEAFYPNEAYAPGEAHVDDDASLRLGPWMRWPLYKVPKGRLRQIVVGAAAQFYLADRFHTGATTPAAVPRTGISITALGDL